ncbi:MAG: UDP-N-acetylmuramate dehydrogenase [Candidatus Omnitrophota bacterium]
MNWPKELKIKYNYPLKSKTTFKIGSGALFFSEPAGRKELSLLVKAAREKKLPVFVLGAGSNLLISDKMVKGLVIKLNSPCFKEIRGGGGLIKAGGAVALAWLIKFARERSLQGLEFLVGIPGTVGGALAMNAGCWGHSFGDFVKEVEIMDRNGKIKYLKNCRVGFGYRKSNLEKYIILSSLLELKKGERSRIEENIARFSAFRRKTQDLSYPNAGCIFKNPGKASAGELIDLCGLKGKNIGDAFVSERHANFILNKGKASSRDVLRLMRLIKSRVKDKFKLNLQPEIKIWK